MPSVEKKNSDVQYGQNKIKVSNYTHSNGYPLIKKKKKKKKKNKKNNCAKWIITFFHLDVLPEKRCPLKSKLFISTYGNGDNSEYTKKKKKNNSQVAIFLLFFKLQKVEMPHS